MKHKKNILLVEDDIVTVAIERNILEKFGYNVVTINTGEQAVEMIKTNREVDLVLMDIYLGDGIDGIKAAELILQDRDVPIIFLSSHHTHEVMEKTEQITSYGYVLKNSGFAVLDTSIKMALKLFEAKSKLIQSEKKYRLLVETLKEGIWAIDKDSKTIFVNRYMAEMLGYTVKDMLGKPLFDFMDEQGVKIARQKIELRTRGVSERFDFELLHKDGHRVQVSIQTTLTTDEKGNYTGMLAAIIDITNQKRMEEEIVRVSSAERERVALDLHDSVAQQVAAVGYRCNLLKNKLNEPDHKKAMEEIETGLRESLYQIRHVSYGLFPVGVEHKGLVHMLENLTENVSKTRKINCRLEHSGNCQLDFERQFAAHLYYLVHEAVMNAVQHADPENIIVSCSGKGVTIRDDGRGFDMNETMKTGMGLRIMRYRVGILGGRLEIESEKNAGTSIRVVWGQGDGEGRR